MKPIINSAASRQSLTRTHSRSGLVGSFLSAIVIFFAMASATPMFAQSPTPSLQPEPSPSATPEPDKKDDDDDKSQKKPKRGSFIVAPIPIISPTFGSGLILGVGYIFKLDPKDTSSPPSTIGAAGAFTSSGSRGGVLGGRFYFHENKYQAAFAFGKGRAN